MTNSNITDPQIRNVVAAAKWKARKIMASYRKEEWDELKTPVLIFALSMSHHCYLMWFFQVWIDVKNKRISKITSGDWQLNLYYENSSNNSI